MSRALAGKPTGSSSSARRTRTWLRLSNSSSSGLSRRNWQLSLPTGKECYHVERILSTGEREARGTFTRAPRSDQASGEDEAGDRQHGPDDRDDGCTCIRRGHIGHPVKDLSTESIQLPVEAVLHRLETQVHALFE